MTVYVVRRLLLAAGVVVGVSLVTFILAYLVPADPARVYAGSNATAQTVAPIRDPLGLAQGPSSIVLPAVTVGLSGGVWYARLLRSSMLETLGTDYVRTGRAKGLAGHAVVLRHALPNAITPIVTQLGLDMAYFLG